MSEYSLSVVQVCPDAYKEAANAIAEAAGYGPNNLSVRLVDQSGGVWWGCHAWWKPEVFGTALELPEWSPSEWQQAMANVISSAKFDTDTQQHWREALSTNGLTLVEQE